MILLPPQNHPLAKFCFLQKTLLLLFLGCFPISSAMLISLHFHNISCFNLFSAIVKGPEHLGRSKNFINKIITATPIAAPELFNRDINYSQC